MVRIGPLSIGVLGLAGLALLVPIAQGFTKAGGVATARGAGAGFAGFLTDPLGNIFDAIGGAFKAGEPRAPDPSDVGRGEETCREVSVFTVCEPHERSRGVPGLNKFCCTTGDTVPPAVVPPLVGVPPVVPPVRPPPDVGVPRPPPVFVPPIDPNPHNCNRGRGEIWRPEFNACLNDQEFEEFKRETEPRPGLKIPSGASVDSIFHLLGILHPGGQRVTTTHNLLNLRANDLGFQVRAFQAGQISQEDLRQGFRQAATRQ